MLLGPQYNAARALVQTVSTTLNASLQPNQRARRLTLFAKVCVRVCVCLCVCVCVCMSWLVHLQESAHTPALQLLWCDVCEVEPFSGMMDSKGTRRQRRLSHTRRLSITAITYPEDGLLRCVLIGCARVCSVMCSSFILARRYCVPPSVTSTRIEPLRCLTSLSGLPTPQSPRPKLVECHGCHKIGMSVRFSAASCLLRHLVVRMQASPAHNSK